MRTSRTRSSRRVRKVWDCLVSGCQGDCYARWARARPEGLVSRACGDRLGGMSIVPCLVLICFCRGATFLKSCL